MNKRKVIFRSWGDWGSTLFRGTIINNHLNKLGYNSESYNYTKTIENDIQDSIVVYLKFLNRKQNNFDREYEILKKNNNKIILDVIDSMTDDRYLTENFYDIDYLFKYPLDGVLVSTTSLKNKLYSIKSDWVVENIPHIWDPRLKSFQRNLEKDGYKFRLGYIGKFDNRHDRGNLPYKDISDLNLVTKMDDSLLKLAKNYTCHYSIRLENTLEYMYKPCTKVALASAVNSNIIHSRDKSLEGILPNDYPYLTDTDINSVKKMVEYAKETFNSEIWNTGLDMMKEVKHKTSVETVCNNYIDYFKELGM